MGHHFISEVYVTRRALFRNDDDGDGIDEVEAGIRHGKLGIPFLEVEILPCRGHCGIWYMVG